MRSSSDAESGFELVVSWTLSFVLVATELRAACFERNSEPVRIGEPAADGGRAHLRSQNIEVWFRYAASWCLFL